MLEIIIDTREQCPWHFSPDQATVRRGALKTGDYALDGDEFAIERKSLDDFIGTISSGWIRFLAEIQRMDGWPAKIVIVEGDFSECVFKARQGEIIPPQHSHYKITPRFVLRRIGELSMLGVSVIFAGNSDSAAALCCAVLKRRKEMIDGVAGDC